jgi:RecA C-terminal domain
MPSGLQLGYSPQRQLKDLGGHAVGSHVRAKVIKNRFAPPFREAEYNAYYLSGISRIDEILDSCVENKLVKTKGPWFYFSERYKAEGRSNAKHLLNKNPGLYKEMPKKLDFPEEMNLDAYHKANFSQVASEHLESLL